MRQETKGALIYWGSILGVFIASCILVGWGISSCQETPCETAALYTAWCRVNPTIEIGIEEWQALRNNHLLPGQSTKEQ